MQYTHSGLIIRLRNDQHCVRWGVKLYSLAHCNSHQHLRREFDWPTAFAVRFTSVHFGRMRGQNHYVSLRFNVASVDMIHF